VKYQRYQKFDIRPKKVEYDDIRFDSKLELLFYKRIIKYSSFHVVYKPLLRGASWKWKIDFGLYPANETGRKLLQRLNSRHGVFLFVEIKGILDKNFLRKYSSIIREEINNDIIILSTDYKAAIFPDTTQSPLGYLVKPVYPMKVFFEVLDNGNDNEVHH
jgi:hypothetical protein